MKEFDLEAALNGEPVKLACGRKAYILYDLSRYPKLLKHANRRPLNGLVMSDCKENNCYPANWLSDGKNLFDQDNVIGMWEEPKLTSEQVLEKAYNEDLLVLCDGNPDLPLKIIAKTKDGEFVMQPEDDTIQPWLANLTMEWFFAKELDPKLDAITNTIALPKPFKPKDGESYFYITGGIVEYEDDYWDSNKFDKSSAERGGCYRTREDAQKWLDFMKSMME